MPRRLLLVACAVVALGVAAAIAGVSLSRAGDGEPRYTVELVAATGLTEGGDVKLGGVRAGRIDTIDLDPRTRRALVEVVLTKPGFDRLQADATCRIRPQSLIGEYYLDCQPGRSDRPLRGNRVPAAQTSGTIGLDLLTAVLRRPERDRLRIILAELGVGVAARGPELNETIRRAVPALRETNRLLGVLAAENRTLERLVRDADLALAPVDRRRADLARYVRETGEAAEISATRRRELAEQFEALPGFLTEATPAMRELGATADAQAAAISELDRGRGRVEALLGATSRFTRASVPATRALAATARAGRPVVRRARPVVGELRRALGGGPELSQNLAIVLEHLDDRDNAIEPDPRSPGGLGFTGLEAFLQYARNQVLSINVFDDSGYKLKANLLEDPCGTYGDADTARAQPECTNHLGPNQPGINSPDPSPPPAARRDGGDAAVLREAARGRAPAAGDPATDAFLELLLR